MMPVLGATSDLRIATGPFRYALELLSLPADRLAAAMGLLAFIVVMCELTRIALATPCTRSVATHVLVCLFTFAFQAVLMAGVLILAAYRHPERAWINLLFVLGLYALWYVAGQSTRWIRPDTEGADLGFMSVGALITFPVGILAAVIF